MGRFSLHGTDLYVQWISDPLCGDIYSLTHLIIIAVVAIALSFGAYYLLNKISNKNQSKKISLLLKVLSLIIFLIVIVIAFSIGSPSGWCS